MRLIETSVNEGINKDIWTHKFDIDYDMAKREAEHANEGTRRELDIAKECITELEYKIAMRD